MPIFDDTTELNSICHGNADLIELVEIVKFGS